MPEYEKKSPTCHTDDPYPPVTVCGKNPCYARMMLDDLGGRVSEISAVTRYFYNHLETAAWQDISSTFHSISVVEMHHLEIFGTLALKLGEDPRLWARSGNSYRYWSPSYNNYPCRLNELLDSAIQSEIAARDKYLRQCGLIDDPSVRDNLSRIAKDEELHIQILQRLFTQYC